MAANRTDIDRVATGRLGLLRQEGPDAPVTVAAHTGGTVVDVAGTAGPRRIAGLAPGAVAPGSTEAVNGDQMYRAVRRIDTLAESTDRRFDQVNRRIDRNRREANEGISLSLATANLRYADVPGRTSIAMGGGYWQDQAGLALGVGYTTPSGKTRFNLSLAGAPGSGNLGVGVGVSFLLD